jgi:hypothetical protein
LEEDYSCGLMPPDVEPSAVSLIAISILYAVLGLGAWWPFEVSDSHGL